MAEAVRSPDPALAEWEDLLRALAIRITPIRVLLLTQLETEGLASADTLYEATLPLCPGLNLATIYRTLDLLIDKGLVTGTPGRAAKLFLLAGSGDTHLTPFTVPEPDERSDRARREAGPVKRYPGRNSGAPERCHFPDDQPAT